MNELSAGVSLTPRNLTEAMNFADVMSKSSIVPKDFQGNPGNILVAVQWGMELGLQPLQAMQNIAVINGRPALWGDAVIALVRSSSLCEYVREDLTDGVATCRVKRRGEEEQVRTFSMQDAQRAGLAGKSGPWSQYPSRMLQMRARSWALRDVFPDVLRGMPVAEEVMDIERDVTPRSGSASGLPDPLVEHLDAIARAQTIESLQAAFSSAYRAFPLTGDRKRLTESKDARKQAILSAAVVITQESQEAEHGSAE